MGNKMKCCPFSKKNITIAVILVLLSFPKLILALQLPVIGDGCFHAGVSQEIIDTELLPTTLERITTDYPEGYPFLYTQFFYILLAVSSVFTDSFKVLSPLLGILTILVFYLLGSNLFKSEVYGLLCAFVAACYPQFILYTSTVFQESLVIFLFCLVLYVHHRSLESDSYKYSILAGLFIGAACAVKASLFFLVPVILAQHLLLKGSNKNLMVTFAISGLFVLPFFIFLYTGTGTFLFPTSNPLIDNLLPSKFVYSESAATVIREILINRVVYSVNYYDPSTLLAFFTPSTYFYDGYHMDEVFVLVFIVGGFLLLIQRDRLQSLWLLIPIVVYLPVLQMTKLTRYFIPVKLLGAFFIAFAFYIIIRFISSNLRNHKLKFLLPIVVVLLIVPFATTAGWGFWDTTNKAYTAIWQPSAGSMDDSIHAYEFINRNSAGRTNIVCPDVNSAYYYTDASIYVYWINWYGNAELYLPVLKSDLQGIKVQFHESNISYLVVFKNQLVPRDKMSHTNQFPLETYYLIRSSPSFQLLFKEGDVEIFEYIHNS